jgi:hypothetical protein
VRGRSGARVLRPLTPALPARSRAPSHGGASARDGGTALQPRHGSEPPELAPDHPAPPLRRQQPGGSRGALSRSWCGSACARRRVQVHAARVGGARRTRGWSSSCCDPAPGPSCPMTRRGRRPGHGRRSAGTTPSSGCWKTTIGGIRARGGPGRDDGDIRRLAGLSPAPSWISTRRTLILTCQ